MKRLLIFLSWFIFAIPTQAQILNGGFESWENQSGYEVAEHWTVNPIEYAELIVRDTIAYEGNYSIKLMDQPLFSEGDCKRWIDGSFQNQNNSDSLILQFASKSESFYPQDNCGLKVEINGQAFFITPCQPDSFIVYNVEFENPGTEELFIRFESIAYSSAIDGCYEAGIHWIDAVSFVNEDGDEDGDGFLAEEDCDNTNANINPDAEEIPNNDVDEDCDGEILIIDEDNDGFNSDEDCDDSNADIYPGAEEILDNDIDEDCDGADLSDVHELDGIKLNLYPNPTHSELFIQKDKNIHMEVKVINMQGQIVYKSSSQIEEIHKIDLSAFGVGTYLIEITNPKSHSKVFEKVVKMD